MKISGKDYRILKTYSDSFLVISEIGFEYKVIPKLQIIK